MANPVIEIHIKGLPGVGKSAVAQLIVQTLRDAGALEKGRVCMVVEHEHVHVRSKSENDLAMKSILDRGTNFAIVETLTSSELQKPWFAVNMVDEPLDRGGIRYPTCGGIVDRTETNENSTVNVDLDR